MAEDTEAPKDATHLDQQPTSGEARPADANADNGEHAANLEMLEAMETIPTAFDGPTDGTSYDQHPLYLAAIEDWKAKDRESAAAKLRLLAVLYPEETSIQDLVRRVEGMDSEEYALEETKASSDTAGYDQHPLYLAAREDWEAGDEDRRAKQYLRAAEHYDGAAEKLVRLATIYPDEPIIKDLAARARTNAFGARQETQPASRPRPEPRRILRYVVTFLLLVVVCLMLVAAFSAAYQGIVIPTREAVETQIALRDLKVEAEQRVAAGDWLGCIEKYTALLEQAPGDPTAPSAREAIAYCQGRQVLDALNVEANLAIKQEDWEKARTLLNDLKRQDATYPGLAERLQFVQEQLDLKAQLEEAQQLIQQGDLTAAVPILEALHIRKPEYRQVEVEDQLHQLYTQAALVLIDEADGDTDQMRLAIDYLKKALKLRPNNQEYENERKMAEKFVKGADAYARQDWLKTVEFLEPVYRDRPGYQGGEVAAYLRQAYPLAAQQLLAQANGNTTVLGQAVLYLDEAIARDPQNSQLAEERRLAAEYIEGVEAFAKGDWQLAIALWGPIYQLRPDYQNGVLREKLRAACTSSSAPDEVYCKP